MSFLLDCEAFVAVLVPVMTCAVAQVLDEGSEMQVVRERLNWDMHAQRLLLEGEFNQYYRMSMGGFERLLFYVGADLAVDPLQSARRALGEPPVSPASMLQTCVSWLAGGSYHHIRVITGTSRASFYRIVKNILRAINRNTKLAIVFPESSEEIEFATAGFRSLSTGGAIPGCIGAIDGWLCSIQVPRRSDCGRVVAFFSGHYQRYGLNVQACCDYKSRFTAMTCRAPGGRNDSVAFSQWSLSDTLTRIRGPYFVIGDNAYLQTRVILTPFNQAQTRGHPDRDNYNFYLSQCRIRIEMAFGLLVNKWRIFKRPLRVRLQNCGQVIHACMRLHNFCIDQHTLENGLGAKKTIKAMRRELRTWNESRDLSYWHSQVETDGGEVVEVMDELTRVVVMEHIAASNLHRPAHNVARRHAIDD